jgi:hypothetical protein
MKKRGQEQLSREVRQYLSRLAQRAGDMRTARQTAARKRNIRLALAKRWPQKQEDKL